jgi:TIR domain-containing protein
MAKAFISYSHRDEKALERLHTHLATLRRERTITAWFDREILAGDDIDSTIDSNLTESEIFLALVSPDFLASNYCYEQEMAKALERHAEGTLRVVPVILEPCDWKSTPLGKLKALPKDGKAISTWTNENIAYLDVVTELRRIFSEQQQPNQSAVTEEGVVPRSGKRETRRYRIKKEFDSIDRDDFRQKAFATIQDFFRQSVDELNEIGDSIRARFERMSDLAFSCTVLNKGTHPTYYVLIRLRAAAAAPNKKAAVWPLFRNQAIGFTNSRVHRCSRRRNHILRPARLRWRRRPLRLAIRPGPQRIRADRTCGDSGRYWAANERHTHPSYNGSSDS